MKTNVAKYKEKDPEILRGLFDFVDYYEFIGTIKEMKESKKPIAEHSSSNKATKFQNQTKEFCINLIDEEDTRENEWSLKSHLNDEKVDYRAYTKTILEDVLVHKKCGAYKDISMDAFSRFMRDPLGLFSSNPMMLAAEVIEKHEDGFPKVWYFKWRGTLDTDPIRDFLCE